MVAGLIGSLTVRRRRLWMRLSPAGDDVDAGKSRTRVTVGGLARSDSGNFTAEFAALAHRLHTVAPVASALSVPDLVRSGQRT